MGLTEASAFKDGKIVNDDVNASASIQGTKISPDFGSQNIVTTGTLGSGNITVTSNNPQVEFVDSSANPATSMPVTAPALKATLSPLPKLSIAA